MLKASFTPYSLQFIHTVRTSRGEMRSKQGFLLNVLDENAFFSTGTGECTTLKDLSFDDKPEYQDVIRELCHDISSPEFRDIQFPHALTEALLKKYIDWPSICFGLECALLDLAAGGKGILFESDFTKAKQPIAINGLIWMGNYTYMLKQIEEKLAAGYKVIKLKIGGIDLESEINLLRYIRDKYSPEEVTIRLDANGAFEPSKAPSILDRLARFGIHSIEQPIKAGQPEQMAVLCAHSPIPIALDEELIGCHSHERRRQLMDFIKPPFIILKPSLLGGFAACNDWIAIAREMGTGFWITSALESNIGLNAIAQYTATLDTNGLAQGLGTGGLYVNNFPSRLSIRNGELWFSL